MALRDTPESCEVGDGVLASNAPFNASLAIVQFSPEDHGMHPGGIRDMSGAMVDAPLPTIWIFRQERYQTPDGRVAAWLRES